MKHFLLFFAIFFLAACQTTHTEHGPHEANALINESSPYLLQHAYNPVKWHPWGEEALKKAEEEDKMLVISVGYSACHWCHVMEHESFEDTTVARIMNENFVAIKVDREERPDVDDVYMTACQLSSRRGCGWPLNAFAMPDGRPVWAGTYFPKDQWVKILNQFIDDYKTNRLKLENNAHQLTNSLSAGADYYQDKDDTFEASKLQGFAEEMVAGIDENYGGRKGTQKFPLPDNYAFLMAYNNLDPGPQYESVLYLTLDNLAAGGIYDQIGGGFARYTTDPKWLVPHFEKMLYDNSQLVSLFSDAYSNTGNETYRKVVEETLIFIERELTHKSGGFYSSLDADSDGEEGKYYVWTQTEIDSLLTIDEANFITAYYNTKKAGNWEEHKNILHITDNLATVCDKQKISSEEGKELLASAQEKMMSYRDTRIRPGLDDKILTSWNALMLQGYVSAYMALGKSNYLDAALENAQFLEKEMLQEDGRLNRNFKDGKSSINAFLDDYAILAQAYTKLYGVTFDVKWLHLAQKITDYALVHFDNPSSPLFYYTSDIDPPLVSRKMEVEDNVIASANSTFAEVLFLLGVYLDEASYTEHARNMLGSVAPKMATANAASFYSNWAQLYLHFVHPPYEVAILGKDYQTQLQRLQKNYLPNALFLGGTSEGDLKLLENKLVEDETFIYVCQNKVCKLPVQSANDALPLME